MIFPHSVRIVRQTEGTDEDELGRKELVTASSTSAPAWIQSRSAREIEQFSERGVVVGAYQVFIIGSADLRESDYLVTEDTGGMTSGLVHRVLGVRDPDGLRHHYEVETRLVAEVGA